MQTGINLMIRKSPNLSTSVVKSSITMTKIGLIFTFIVKSIPELEVFSSLAFCTCQIGWVMSRNTINYF